MMDKEPAKFAELLLKFQRECPRDNAGRYPPFDFISFWREEAVPLCFLRRCAILNIVWNFGFHIRFIGISYFSQVPQELSGGINIGIDES